VTHAPLETLLRRSQDQALHIRANREAKYSMSDSSKTRKSTTKILAPLYESHLFSLESVSQTQIYMHNSLVHTHICDARTFDRHISKTSKSIIKIWMASYRSHLKLSELMQKFQLYKLNFSEYPSSKIPMEICVQKFQKFARDPVRLREHSVCTKISVCASTQKIIFPIGLTRGFFHSKLVAARSNF